DRLREDMLIEREISHQALQAIVLVLELPKPAHLAHTQMRVLLLPDIERRLTHAELSADVRYRHATLDLAQRVRHLLLAEPRPLHCPASLGIGADREANLLSFYPARLFWTNVNKAPCADAPLWLGWQLIRQYRSPS